MKKLLLTFFIACLFLGFGATKIHAEEIHTKEMFSIPPQNWIFNSGMNKGKYHDRQDLGFILSPNTVLKVRQVNPNFKGNVAIRLLADADAVEPLVYAGPEWTTISSTVATVPFATTQYDTVNPKLEYVVESKEPQKPLPIYNHGDSEKQFFNTWDKYDCEYGLIKGKDFQLFVPKAGKELARYPTSFPSLDGVIDYYERVFAFYNKTAGFDNSSPTNKLGTNRYFLKARKDGSSSVLAYYSTNWTAHISPSGSLWFGKTWGPLHEIGHGYQTGLDGRGMYTGEVFNNIFAALFQYQDIGKKEADSTGWLFNGNKVKTDADLYKSMVKNPGTYETVSTREKALLQLSMLQKAGFEAFTKMYQGYRLETNNGREAGTYYLPNELNRYYSEYSGFDFTPVLERWGYKMPAEQVSINRSRGYQAVASLADVVPESHLLAARALIDPKTVFNSSFEMVTNQEIASLGLNGALTVKLNEADVAHLKGTKMVLKDGKKVVQEQMIKGQDVAFQHVPNGIYTVEFLGNAMGAYEIPQYYAYVKEAQNELTIPALQQIAPTNVANQKITLKGISDKEIGYVQTDVGRHQVTVAITTSSPHSYFGSTVYVRVKIFNAKGDLVYEKEATGSNAKTETKVLPFEAGDKVELYHAEASRQTASDPILVKSKDNVLLMTKWGLRNEELKNDPEQDLIRKIDAEGKRITENEGLKATPFIQSPEKKNLELAIDLLSEPFKGEYLEKYAPILSSALHYGDTFDFTFKRTDATPFATMQVDLSKKQATIDTEAGKPNLSSAEKYAAILIQSDTGIKKYERNYHGTTNYTESQKTVNLVMGDYITVYHAAGDKQLRIVNQDSQAALSTTNKAVTYQVTREGLQCVPEADVPSQKQADPTITAKTTIGDKTLSGTATPGMSVEVVIQNRVVGTATANEVGQWETTVPALLVDQVIYAKTSLDGQVAESTHHTVTPEKPSLTSVLGAGETKVTGTASPGVKVGITINGSTVSTVTASATGEWTGTVSALIAGQKLQAKVVAGNQQVESDSYTIVPKKPSITATLTTKEATTITGQAVPGAKVEIATQNKTIVSGVANPAGQVTITIPALTAGQTIRLQATFGTQTQTSEDFVVAPEKPTITSPVVGKATKLTGTTSPGAVVAMLVQGNVVATGAANDKGEWTATVPALIGGQTVQVKATMDATDQVSDSYTVAPDKPIIQAPLTAKDTTIKGTTSPKATVQVSIENTLVDTVSADDAGQWTATVPALTASDEVQAEASLANQSQKSDVYTVIQEKPTITSKLVEGETQMEGLATPNSKVDVWIQGKNVASGLTDTTGHWRAVVPTLVSNQNVQPRAFIAGAYVDAVKVQVGLDNLAKVKAQLHTATSHVTVSGEGASKATITIKAGTLTIGTGVTDDQGHFEITVPAQAEGTVLSLTQTKNTQTSPVTESVVYVKLAKPSDISTVSEHSASITGKGAAEATVHVVANGHEIGHAKVNATGHFTVPIPKQAEGTVLSITQAKGDNESDAVEVTVVSGRLEAPTLTPYYTGIAYIRGKAAVGSTKVTLNIDGKNIRTVNVNADGTFSIYANDIPALKQAGTKFEIVAQNAHNQTSEATESTVQAVQAPALKPYQAGQEFVTGTVATDVTKIGLYDKAGTLLRYGQINTDGTYQILAKDKAALQQAGDGFSVKAFNALGAVSEETKGIVTAPPATLAPPTIADYYAASTYIRGKAPTGATSITLAINGKNIRNGAIAADGSYSIYAGDIALLKEKGTTFSVTARDANNQASKEVTSTVLGILPPVVAPYQVDQTYITGIVEKGATKIGLYDKDNKLIRYGQINPNGTFKIYAKDTNLLQTVGTTFIVKSIDAQGSVSIGAQGKVSATIPTDPLTITNYQVGAAYIKGKAPEGSTSIAILIDGKSIRTGSVAPDGNYSIYVSGVEELKQVGTVFHVVAYDANKQVIKISTSEVKALAATK
ncbi:Ig-like domain-containing protein [Listeria grandensis]|uniref:Ig-like domain-containing protein n=1 Tax=Listeria grandensis TaxID=1494963 RepID=UPI00164E9FB0|nr:Ig-like domain-containing protein [Listeria grandensis]MBC6314424.1 hypothetical protein [Listeria grandensis]